jgi:ribosomal protection tetracycline resistance protein
VLVFVNKIDRGGARSEALLGEIAAKLGIEVVPMGSVRDVGTKHAAFVPYAGTAAEVVEPLADHDDLLLTAYLADRPMTAERVRSELAELTRTGQVYPVVFGSAITGAGVAELTAGIVALRPAASGDADADPSGSVFKIERGQGGEKVALIRMFNGSVRIRDRLRFGAAEDTVTRISVVESGAGTPAEAVTAGRIARVWGLAHARIGDPVGPGRRCHHAQKPSPSSRCPSTARYRRRSSRPLLLMSTVCGSPSRRPRPSASSGSRVRVRP